MALQEDPAEAPAQMLAAPIPDLSQLNASAGSSLSEADARQQVLNRIASGEANSYNELYGGHTFSSYEDHPRVAIPITSGPHVGMTSSAAGRYQFLAPTWDDEARRLGLKDFSPDSQDAAAWDLADRTYRGATGRSLLGDAQKGNVQWGVLGGQWESLQGAGSGPGLAKTAWGGRQWSNAQPALIGASPSSPAPVNDPLHIALAKYDLLRSAFPQHSLTPVSYDPWKYVSHGAAPAA